MTTNAQPNSAAIEGMVMWYSADIYPLLERLGFDKSKEIVDVAQAHSGANPLWMEPKPIFELPYHDKKVTGGYVMALMSAFIVWTQKKAGNPLPDSSLLKAAESGYQLWKLEKGKKP